MCFQFLVNIVKEGKLLKLRYSITKGKAEPLVADSEEIGLKVNADKTKFVVMSTDKNGGRSHRMKSDNSSFERVEELKCLGTTLTDQTSIQE